LNDHNASKQIEKVVVMVVRVVPAATPRKEKGEIRKNNYDSVFAWEQD
jgi:hypothetical protein